MDDAYVVALKAERVGYVLSGKTARVAAVDAELARLGVRPAAAPAPVERAVTVPAETSEVKRGPGRPRRGD
jgi:hypothetical protein